MKAVRTATFPSSQRRGGRAAGADGVARSASPIGRRLNRRPAKGLSRADHPGRFAATPPLRGGESALIILACALFIYGVEASAAPRLVFGLQAAYGLENSIPRNVSHIQMFYAQPQVGIVIWDSPESKLPIKRFEIVSEGILGGAIHPGGHLFGDTLMFRVAGDSTRRLVPFFNVSSGPLHTTLDEKAPELGGHIQFISQGGVGVQRRLNTRQSVVVEYRYFHMSNAGLTQPNHGFNGSMLSIGMRWN